MPFLAGRGAWLSALSRPRVFRVHRSEAESLLWEGPSRSSAFFPLLAL